MADRIDGAESGFGFGMSGEVSMEELMKPGGKEAFAQRMRNMLEERLRPILAVDWPNLNLSPMPPAPQPQPEPQPATAEPVRES